MLGNDIIDLKLALKRRNAENPRFLKKLFCQAEIHQIINSLEPEIQLWILWSMKEAVYKSHQRKNYLLRKFNPKAFSCQFNTALQIGKVRVNNTDYDTVTEVKEDYIHTKCFENTKDYFSVVDHAVSFSKQKMLEHIEVVTGSNLTNFFLIKNRLGIPSLYNDNLKIDIPLSLSHHGNFSAFIVPLIKS